MKLIRITFLLLCTIGFAQTEGGTKVGTIDIDYILSQMPEITDVAKQVEDYGKGLDADMQKKLDDYQALVKDYQDTEATLTIAQRKVKQDTIVARENDINRFQQNGQRLIALQREQFLQPLYKKIGDALEKLAKAQGYTQVLQRDATLVYIDNRFDLTLPVLKEMGIEPKEEE